MENTKVYVVASYVSQSTIDSLSAVAVACGFEINMEVKKSYIVLDGAKRTISYEDSPADATRVYSESMITFFLHKFKRAAEPIMDEELDDILLDEEIDELDAAADVNEDDEKEAPFAIPVAFFVSDPDEEEEDSEPTNALDYISEKFGELSIVTDATIGMTVTKKSLTVKVGY